MKNLPGLLLVSLVLVFAFWLLTIKIDKPFWGHHDWIGIQYSNVARNYNRYGFLTTKFGQVLNVDYQKPENFGYITHYPPGLPIMISLSFRLLGESESSARLTIVFFSLLLLFLIYKIGRELHSPLMGLYASLALVITPIFAYFGKLPVHDVVVPSVSMAGFWAYLRYFKTKDSKYYLLLIAAIIFGGLINWSAYYLVVALLFLQIIYKTPNFFKKKILLLIPISLITFAIQLVHVRLLQRGLTGDVFSNVLSRINPYLTSDLYGFTLIKYLKQEILLAKVYYTPPVFIAAVGFLFYLACRFIFRKQKFNFAEASILSLLVYGLLQLVVFSQLSFIHDFMIYYLSPFMVLAFSYITFKILARFQKSLVFPVVLIAILNFAFLSQLKFTKALIATDTNKRGFLAGRLINKESPSSAVSFITSNSYKEFQEVFIGYYADRNIAYGESLPRNFDSLYFLVIRPKDHDPLDQKAKQILDDKYLRYEDENFIWYKLKLKKSI